MMNYISKIQYNLKYYKKIHTNKTTSHILDGSYNSVYKGRSMNFDELREYVPGDDVKDIDWKATARSQKILIKQYIAEKKHNLMLVVDTNKRMLADSASFEKKSEVGLIAAGTLAYMVNSNGDYVSAVYPTSKSIQYFPFKTGLFNIENIMSGYDKEVSKGIDTDINSALDYILHNLRRKMIMVIVTDISGMISISESALKRLLVVHDVLFVCVSDTGIAGKKTYNIAQEDYMPAFVTQSKSLAKKEAKQKEIKYNQCLEKLNRYGVAMTIVDSVDDMDKKLIELLEKHKVEKR